MVFCCGTCTMVPVVLWYTMVHVLPQNTMVFLLQYTMAFLTTAQLQARTTALAMVGL